MQEKKQYAQNGGNNIICPEGEEANRKPPLKFWQIDPFFACPVVGMCLTLSEQKQILKKAGCSIKNKNSFEIHEALVASSQCESRLSRKVDSLLTRKFGKEAAFLLGLDHEAFKKHFKADFEAGDCIGVSWAAAINPGLPIELKREFFGDIHMMMHWCGEQTIKLRQRLAGQQEELDRLRRRIEDAKRLRCSLQKENKHLRQSDAALRCALVAAERKNAGMKMAFSEPDSRDSFSELEKENQSMQDKVKDLIVNAKEKQRQIILLKEKNMRLLSKLDREQDSNMRFRKQTSDIIKEVSALKRCDTTCPSFDLCKKRILIVGGITRMATLYRELIEGSGGIFEYHDGYIKKGVKNLECRLRRADMVVCPVNCNSHAACSIVKNMAKKHNKKVHMLATSSLNAVSQAIRGGGRGHNQLGPVGGG